MELIFHKNELYPIPWAHRYESLGKLTSQMEKHSWAVVGPKQVLATLVSQILEVKVLS